MDAEAELSRPAIQVEVVFARPDRQQLLAVSVPPGTSAREALKYAGLDRYFPELDMAHVALGVFGKRLHDPDAYKLADGDRVEVYRDLTRDPKQARIARARNKQ